MGYLLSFLLWDKSAVQIEVLNYMNVFSVHSQHKFGTTGITLLRTHQIINRNTLSPPEIDPSRLGMESYVQSEMLIVLLPDCLVDRKPKHFTYYDQSLNFHKHTIMQ